MNSTIENSPLVEFGILPSCSIVKSLLTLFPNVGGNGGSPARFASLLSFLRSSKPMRIARFRRLVFYSQWASKQQSKKLYPLRALRTSATSELIPRQSPIATNRTSSIFSPEIDPDGATPSYHPTYYAIVLRPHFQLRCRGHDMSETYGGLSGESFYLDL